MDHFFAARGTFSKGSEVQLAVMLFIARGAAITDLWILSFIFSPLEALL
jgi:hypothetical protein